MLTKVAKHKSSDISHILRTYRFASFDLRTSLSHCAKRRKFSCCVLM